MPWKPFKLRDADVWARVDATGAPIADKTGRVEVIYKAAGQAKVYRASKQNLTDRPGEVIELDSEPVAEAAEGKARPALGAGSKAAVGKPGAGPGGALPADAIHLWTDGGASPNPGPAAIGVVIIDGKQQLELSEYLGEGTNQIAELTAMLRGLQEVTDRQRTVVVYSDSAYAIGLLSQGWKAKANVELVAELRALRAQFRDVRFVKVLAHSGIPLNERADQLVNDARIHRQRRRAQVS